MKIEDRPIRQYVVRVRGHHKRGHTTTNTLVVRTNRPCMVEKIALKRARSMKFEFWEVKRKSQRRVRAVRVEVTEAREAPYASILLNWIAGTPHDRMNPSFRKVTVGKRAENTEYYVWQAFGPMNAWEGTRRMSYDANGMLWSYKMELALRTEKDGETFFLVNGDGAPTGMSRQHQREMRSYLSSTKWNGTGGETMRRTKLPHAFVPFSVLRRAGISPRSVTVIATTPDRNVMVKRRRKNFNTGEMEVKMVPEHFLGETLFRVGARYFVCGLDRNDDPAKRMFYLCQIPTGVTPKTVDEALISLRPEGLPRTAKRQGEWFLVPSPKYKPEKPIYATRIPILSDKPKEQLQAITPLNGIDVDFVRDRIKRHVATRMVVNGAVYVSGMIRDDEHSPLKLGEVWHKVVKNRAVEGYRYVPATRLARVD